MTQQVRALYAACERVPGPTSPGTRMAQLILGFGGQLEADALSLKSEELAHIQRLGTARMMRVPAPETGLVERISAFQRALKRQLEGDSYDLCHAGDAWAAAVATQHREAATDLVVITELAELPSQTLQERYPGSTLEDRIRQIIRRGETMVLQRSNALVVDTQAARAQLVAAGVAADRVHLIPPGVDDTVFFASSVELRMHEDRVMVFYAGAPDPARGLTPFLAALAQLPPHVHGVVARVKALDAAAEKAVDNHGLKDRITFQDVSNPQKLAAAFQASDVVVVWPSQGAGQVHCGHVPRRMLEAMACRRPVVVLETPGVKEVLQDRQAAMMVAAPGTARALQDAVGALVKDTALRGRVAQRGAELAGSYGWAARLGAYRKLYTQLLGRPFELEEARKGRAGGLAERLKAQRATKAPGVGIMRDEKASPRPATPAPPVAASPPSAAPPPVAPAVTAAPAPGAGGGGRAAPHPAPVMAPAMVPVAPAMAAVASSPSPVAVTHPAAQPPPKAPAPAPLPPPHAAVTLPQAVPIEAALEETTAPGTQDSDGEEPTPLPAPPPSPPAPVLPAMAPVPVMPAMPVMQQGNVPEAWPFGAPVTGSGGGGPPTPDRTPVAVSAPNLPPLVGPPLAGRGMAPSFLTEPSMPFQEEPAEPTPPPTPVLPPEDPWGGDTQAVDQPPDMDPPAPAPTVSQTRNPVVDPFPGQTDRTAQPMNMPTPLPSAAPPGLRSLALLDSVGQDVGGMTPRPSPGGAQDTERLELTQSHLGALYGRNSPAAAPLTLQRAGQLRFGNDATGEQPTQRVHTDPAMPPLSDDTPSPEDAAPPDAPAKKEDG